MRLKFALLTAFTVAAVVTGILLAQPSQTTSSKLDCGSGWTVQDHFDRSGSAAPPSASLRNTPEDAALSHLRSQGATASRADVTARDAPAGYAKIVEHRDAGKMKAIYTVTSYGTDWRVTGVVSCEAKS